MAYTTGNLQTFFTNANGGVAPSAAQTLTLTALANQNAAGTLTDAQALAQTIDLASDTTTAVSVQTYQFFTGSAPSQAGLTYLNGAFTGTGAQASLNGENRFIAQSVALVLGNAAAKTAFNTSYGSLSVADATKAAYNIIVGNAAATAAGINVDAAINFLTSASSVAYYTAYVKANTPATTTAADLDLAVKAAIIGEIMYTATTFNNGAGVGSYATASTNLIKDLADDGLLTANNTAGINLFTAYGTPATSTPGSTVALTTNIDALAGTANDDTYVGLIGTGATVNVGDTIDAGAGNDTLALTNATTGGVTVAAVTLKNLETITVNNTTANKTADAVTVDLSGTTGVTSVLSVGLGDLTVKNAGSAAIGIRDVAYAATATATITGVGAGTVNLSGVTIAKGGVVTVDVTTGDKSAPTTLNVVNGGKAATISELKFGDSTGARTGTLAFNLGAATTIGKLTSGATDELTAVTVSGNGALTITNAIASAALAKFDASANAGGVSVTVDGKALTSFKGSTGADTVTIGTTTLGATAVVDLGAGNDKLTLGIAPTTGATISGGDGTDNLTLTAATVYTASTKAQFTSFETVTLSGATFADATLFSGFSQVGLDGTVTVQNVGANSTFTIEGTSAATITLANATGSSDVVNLNLGLAGKSAATATVAVAGVETLNLNSISGGSTATNTVTVTKAGTDALSKIVVTGAGLTSIDLTNVGHALSLDASAATAGLTVKGDAGFGLNVIGTAVNDTITVSGKGGQINAGKGGDLITLGGGDDIVILKGGDSSLDLTTGVSAGVGNKGGMDTIDGFKAAGVDKIDLTQISGFGSTGQGVATAVVAQADLNTFLAGANIFKDGGGLQRGVLDIQVSAGSTTHFVVVDVDHNGAFTAGTDLVVQLVNGPTAALVNTDFNFGS